MWNPMIKNQQWRLIDWLKYVDKVAEKLWSNTSKLGYYNQVSLIAKNVT